MQKVNINRIELLKAVEKNRGEHMAEFKTAYAGYRDKVIQRLREMLQSTQEGGEIQTNVNLDEPENHTEDYAKIVRMLEMSVEDVIELTHIEFDQYVMDNWHWKGVFKAQVTAYSAKLK